MLLLSGFHCFIMLPGVLSFENSNCVLTGYVYLFIITEDSGPHYSLRLQAAHLGFLHILVFHCKTYSKMQLWHVVSSFYTFCS